MTNKLAKENSPYLLQHATNPVDWYAWGEDAIEKARSENKPIFLSIGYAACHWCHVMAHESFEDPETAALMNEHFVNIKVDREERPDLDNIYMNAVVAMTGQGGWPMSVFLTPEGQPFFGGTYFPPVRRYNMPSFRDVLLSVARVWREDRVRVVQSGEQITQHLKSAQSIGSSQQSINQKGLEEATMNLAQTYDWEYGGWGQAPKFPQPMALEFLLQRATRGDKLALDIANHALSTMAKGGMYDVIGGGFSRYSTDNNWLIPHFEKMLYDNAQLARAYLHAYMLTDQADYRRVCEETLDFIIRELMGHPGDSSTLQGGIFSSLDADSEGEEGKYYLWSSAEIHTILSKAQQVSENRANLDWSEFFMTAYGVTEKGNFEGRVVLQRVLGYQALADRFDLSFDQIPSLLSELHSHLLKVRKQRIRPDTDDKVLVSWNALALVAFAEAARYLGRLDYLEIARRNADFLLTELQPKDRLLRSWRNGRARHNAYLEDYAGLILGLLALYQSDPDPWWFSSAIQLTEDMVKHYYDPEYGFFDTRDDHDPLLIRPKALQDNATPSGNALAAMALLQMSAYTGRGEWRDLAEVTLRSILSVAICYPTSFSTWLCAIDFAIGPIQEIAILGDPDLTQTKALTNTLWDSYRPRCLAAISNYPPEPNSPPLLNDRPLLNDQPTAYVCQHFVCQQPVNSSEDLSAQLQ